MISTFFVVFTALILSVGAAIKIPPGTFKVVGRMVAEIAPDLINILATLGPGSKLALIGGVAVGVMVIVMYLFDFF